MPRTDRPPHIQAVIIPGMAAAALGALETGGIAAAIAEIGLGRMDVYIQFNDGSWYLYPSVNTPLAVAVQADPDGAFPQIRYWPGYQKVMAAPSI